MARENLEVLTITCQGHRRKDTIGWLGVEGSGHHSEKHSSEESAWREETLNI
jgi:hypothetical protein